jgi:hypothetical protein
MDRPTMNEAPIPHHRGVQRRIDHERRSSLISRASAIRSDEVIVLNANGHGLGVAESVCWRMAPAARVVMMQRMDLVKPEQPAEVGELGVDSPAEGLLKPLMENFLDPACKPCVGQYCRQLVVQAIVVPVGIFRRRVDLRNNGSGGN